MAALVTKLGLQAQMRHEAEIVVKAAIDSNQQTRDQHAADLLIVDPGAQHQAATSLVKTLQRDWPEAVVVILTAYDSPLLRNQMRSLGIQHYLTKPIDLLDLEAAIRLALQEQPQPIDAP
jgi:DNA-binding NarL/FixJ family response regulator